MKTKMMVLMAGFMLAACFSVQSQTNAEPKPMVIQTMYLNQTLASEEVNLDSLLVVYKKNILDTNPAIKNSRILRHWWGNDSRQVVMLFELENFGSIQQAFQNQQQKVAEFLEKNPEFKKQWGTVMNQSHHSDEIYRVVSSSQ